MRIPLYLVFITLFVACKPKEKPVEKPVEIIEEIDSTRLIVDQIVWSSMEYHARKDKVIEASLKKKGSGAGYILISSPIASETDSITANFVYDLVETYTDKMVPSGYQYVFDPSSYKLYERHRDNRKELKFNKGFIAVLKGVEANKKNKKKPSGKQ